jgi:kynurenine 3-monooxygenase
MTTSTKKITILGAGLVGSLLAILLRKKGFAVQVFERRPDMRKATGYAGRSINLAMSHRGWQAMQQAELKTELEKIAIPMYGRQIHNLDGSEIFQAYGKNNEAIYSVSRGELNRQLMTAAEEAGASITFNAKCNHVDVNTNTCTLDIDGYTTTIIADLLIGSDGAFSALRNAYMALDRYDYQQFYIGHGYKELSIPAGENNSFLIEKEALHIWPRNNYMLIALPNMDGSFTLTLFFPFEGQESFAALQSDQEITTFFKEKFGDANTIMPQFLDEYKSNPTSSLITVKTNPWIYKDKSLIIGDAAHAIVPFYGQGMNAGFEDCVILMDIIEKNIEQDWTTILAQYQHARKINGDAVAQLALNNFIEMRDLVADPAFLFRKKIEKELGLRYPTQYLSVYEMVSFSHTPYAVALNTADAQHQLYTKIINYGGDFFDNLQTSAFVTQLDNWMTEYDTIAKKIMQHG